MSEELDEKRRAAKQILTDETRPHIQSETQTATIPTRDRAPGSGAHDADSGRPPGDVDEARAIPTDITAREPGEPDAVAQMPAAAPSMTDEEAGLEERPPEGGITPLVRKADG